MSFGQLGALGSLGRLGGGSGQAGFIPGAVTDLRFDKQIFKAGGKRYADFTDISGAAFGGAVITSGQGLVNDGADFPKVDDLGALGLSGMATDGVTIVADVTMDAPQASGFPWAFSLSNGVTANRHGAYWTKSTERWAGLARISGVNGTIPADTVNAPSGTRYKVAASFDPAGTLRVAVDGRVTSTSTSVDLSLQNRLELMYGDNVMEGVLHRLTIYPAQSSEALLASRTS